MQEHRASRTALGTALMRALHSRADPAPLIDDPWGDRLVPPEAIDALRERAGAGAGTSDARVDAYLRASAAYTSVITRARFTEDALHAAVARGATQYVIVGAGFDSYALRVPPQARHVAIYEVDHPATQALKIARVQACAASLPAALHFVSADLAAERLDAALARSPFDATAVTFFAWLGVSMYLSREANLSALRAIAACAAPGSELVFSYVDQIAFDRRWAGHVAASELGAQVAAMGEPFVSGFEPDGLAALLAGVGLTLLEDHDDRALVQRYDPQGLNGLKAHGVSHVARARAAATRASAPA